MPSGTSSAPSSVAPSSSSAGARIAPGRSPAVTRLTISPSSSGPVELDCGCRGQQRERGGEPAAQRAQQLAHGAPGGGAVGDGEGGGRGRVRCGGVRDGDVRGGGRAHASTASR